MNYNNLPFSKERERIMKTKTIFTAAVSAMLTIISVGSLVASAATEYLFDNPSGANVGYANSHYYHNGIDFVWNDAGLLNDPDSSVCYLTSLVMERTDGVNTPSYGDTNYRYTSSVGAYVYYCGHAVFRHRGVNSDLYVF